MTSTQAQTPHMPLDYKVARAKGTKLLALMRSPTPPPTTPFTPSDISKWGYKVVHHDTDTALPAYTDLLTSLSTSPSIHSDANPTGANIAVTYTHSYPVIVDGTTYPATKAYFSSLINYSAGLFIASNNFSPTATLTRYPSDPQPTTPSPLPALKFWSDIAYLQYFSCSPTPSPPALRYILRSNIHNSDTLAILSRIFGVDANPSRLFKRMRWPGKSIKVGNWDGLALLGSPNGFGVGRLVARMCGVVERVVVFFSEEEGFERGNLLFCLKDGEEKSEK